MMKRILWLAGSAGLLFAQTPALAPAPPPAPDPVVVLVQVPDPPDPPEPPEPALLAEPPQQPVPPAPPTPPPGPHAMQMYGTAKSYLGVGVQDIDDARAKTLKLPGVYGVEITRVEDDSPAGKAGIKEGDAVLEYNGKQVEGTEQFIRLVHETPPGRTAKLLISRNGQTQTLTATIGERKGQSLQIQTPDMSRLEQELNSLRWRMPDLPQAFMSWRSGMLGVDAEGLSPQLADFFGVKKGVLVRSVVKDSAAEKAGIKAGDVITKVDNQEVSTPTAITERIRAIGSRKTFPVTVTRNRQELSLNVTLEESPSSEMMPRRIRVNPRPMRMPRSRPAPVQVVRL